MASEHRPLTGAASGLRIALHGLATALLACQSAPTAIDRGLIGAVAGTVTDAAGDPVVGALVHLDIPDSRGLANTDASGRFSSELGLGLVPPGTYPLTVTITPPAASGLQAATVSDSIRLDLPDPPRDTTLVNVVLKP